MAKSYKEYPSVLFDVLDVVEQLGTCTTTVPNNMVLAKRKEFSRFLSALREAKDAGDGFAEAYYNVAKEVTTTARKLDDDTTQVVFRSSGMKIDQSG